MRLLWIAVVLVHALGSIAIGALGCLLPFYWCLPDWLWRLAVTITLGTLLVQMVSSLDVRCVLTDFENVLRKRLGKQPIYSFLEHYFLFWRFNRD